jgi:hypothetical protein
VSQDPPSSQDPYYLDAIFASIRGFAQELESSRRWLQRAEQTENQPWRFTFLREARAGHDRARARLDAVTARLSALGTLPAPLDRIHDNLAAMRTDVAAHAERLVRVEAHQAQAAPIGRA